MKVLLSIKPMFVKKIFSGEKRWEFRRAIFKRPVHAVVVYSSAPQQRIVGEFAIDEIVLLNVAELWSNTSDNAGISHDEFIRYFRGLEHGYAIRIGKLTPYTHPINPWTADENFFPPQSFRYV